jgi:hypothetical protein
MEASAQHGSQGGGPGFTRLMPTWLFKMLFAKESYMRAFPPPQAGLRESGFFEGL